MVVTFLGEGSFRLQSGDLSLLIDPESGRLKADLVLRTEVPASFDPQGAAPGEILFPGEYELKGVEVTGVPLALGAKSEERTAYLVRWEGVAFGILTRLAKIPDAALLEQLNEPDVLILRTGKEFLAPDAAEKVVRQVEPRVALLAHDKSPAELLKALGEKGEPQEKFVFRTKKDLEAAPGTQMLVLKAA